MKKECLFCKKSLKDGSEAVYHQKTHGFYCPECLKKFLEKKGEDEEKILNDFKNLVLMALKNNSKASSPEKNESIERFLRYDSSILYVISNKWNVEFDAENYDGDPNGQGFVTNGLNRGFFMFEGVPLFGFNAGGDWELPVYGIIYEKNGELHGYVPEDGNVFNPVFKSAYGNNDDSDEHEYDECDPIKLVLDIKKKLEDK